MKALQIGIKDFTVDEDGAVDPVDSSGITGQLHQFLVGEAVDEFGLLVAQILALELAQLVGNFFHRFNRLVISIHTVFLQTIVVD